jgi:hypothetical protein
MADAHVSANAAALNLHMAPVYENWLRTHSDTSAVGCGPLEKNWTCPKWHNDQPGVAGTVAAVVSAVGGDAGEVPNCYICCYGRPGFGCTNATPTDTAGSVSDVVPFTKNGFGSFPGSIGWTSASFVVAGILLETYGATAALRDLYPGLSAHLKFYNRNAAAHDPRGLGLIFWDAFGDWNGLAFTSPLFMANAYYILDCTTMASIALALGETQDALTWLAVAAAVNAALPGIYLNATGYWDRGSQGAQAIGVSLALGSPGAQANLTAAAGAQLAADIAARGGHLSTGTLGTRWLLQALSLAGRGDVAVALASTTTPPSVGAMVVGIPPNQPPLGTIWEGWDGPVSNRGSSGNHVRPLLHAGPGSRRARVLRSAARKRAHPPHSPLTSRRAHSHPAGYDGRRHWGVVLLLCAGPHVLFAPRAARAGRARRRQRAPLRPHAGAQPGCHARPHGRRAVRAG